VSVTSQEFRQLEEVLGNLGERIFRWFLAKFHGQAGIDAQAEAEDCFQKLCLKVLVSLSRRNDEVSDAWFWSVANSVFLNHIQRDLRNMKNQRSFVAHGNPELLLGKALEGKIQVDQELRLLNEERERVSRRCINRLPPRLRQHLTLALVDRLPKEEIAEIMGLEPKSLAANLAKAVKRLRAELKEALKK